MPRTSSRRNFLRTCAATAALAPFISFAKESRYRFCAFEKPLQFLSYDEMAALMAECGFEGVEATVRKGGHVLPERVEEDLPKMVEALKKHGLEMTILTSDINNANQPQAQKVLTTAKKLGVTRYRMLWYQYDLSKPVRPQLEAIRPQVKDLVAMNRELGVTGLYQNHSGAKMIGAPLWDIYDVIREHDPKQISIAYDIMHATAEGGLDWPIQFNLIQSHLGAVFVKDFTWQNHKTKAAPLGTGQIEATFFTLLKKANFKGPISVHVEYLERVKDRATQAAAFKKDFGTLRNWLNA
ncbi:MAG: sugar phosphate isomerase/epimerase family protein [Limisphaerales bacterium]